MIDVYISCGIILLLGVLFGLAYVFCRRIEMYDDWTEYKGKKK